MEFANGETPRERGVFVGTGRRYVISRVWLPGGLPLSLRTEYERTYGLSVTLVTDLGSPFFVLRDRSFGWSSREAGLGLARYFADDGPAPTRHPRRGAGPGPVP